jgi:hypothetical protein
MTSIQRLNARYSGWFLLRYWPTSSNTKKSHLQIMTSWPSAEVSHTVFEFREIPGLRGAIDWNEFRTRDVDIVTQGSMIRVDKSIRAENNVRDLVNCRRYKLKLDSKAESSLRVIVAAVCFPLCNLLINVDMYLINASESSSQSSGNGNERNVDIRHQKRCRCRREKRESPPSQTRLNERFYLFP